MIPLFIAIRVGVAIGNPHAWITNEDYPRIALQQHHDGVVAVQFMYDQSGRAFQCGVLASSGWPELDQQTCAAILARARISPARDDAGQPIGTVTGLRYNWVLPDRAPKPFPPVRPDIEIDIAALPKDAKRATIGIMAVIGEDGKVENCALRDKRGTGSEALDQTVCKVLRNDTFASVRDPAGKPMRYLRFINVGFVTSSAKDREPQQGQNGITPQQ